MAKVVTAKSDPAKIVKSLLIKQTFASSQHKITAKNLN
ncbi:hypothetical protein GLIP_4372 [Aliiglaciecola lipolytica E3]|uniref:Uncharacterized protein n=1 Tax=Aliiglaciecola lipolytica E3 TaxID=1127673 RepID=K6YK47_9ALTE|nr:hypothetical protein GLIP_4372 [Aliiglaciecola lipolytica E3]